MLERVALALIVGLPAVWFAAAIGRAAGLLDQPSVIKPHRRPIPYTGGTALTLAMLIGVVGAVPMLAVFGAILAWAVGFIDDLYDLPARIKFIALVPAVLVGAASVGLDPVQTLIGACVGLFLINVFNVVDGLDGLAGGAAAIPLATVAIIGGPFAPLAGAALGATLAFLFFNLPPARIFLGDEGSLPLGYVLWLAPFADHRASAFDFGALLVALWLFPLLNTSYVVFVRRRAGRSVLAGDRSHLYDALHARFGLWRTLLTCWACAAVGAMAAMLIAGYR